IQSLGIQVRNHMSALEPAEVDRVRRALEKDKAENTVEERISRTVIRRRTVGRKDGDGAAAAAAEETRPAARAEEAPAPVAPPPSARVEELPPPPAPEPPP